MKKILFIIIAGLISLAGFGQTTYYVGSTGNDATGDGSIGNPWFTLGKACRTVTTAGDIIYINAGTITGDQDTLSVGVNIIGTGNTSIIINATGNPILYLQSAIEGTNGNQSISYVKFDGNATDITVGIYITARSNVYVHHCTFVNFERGAIRFEGSMDSGAPSIYSTGNRFYNNLLTNCSGYYSGNGYGSLAIGGQQTMLIHDNSIIQIGRTGINGYLIKYLDLGHNKDIKIYNNFLQRQVNNTISAYDIAVELWNSKGAIEIYDNEIYGGAIDFGGDSTQKGDYTYAADVHNNILYFSVADTLNNTGDERMAVSIEANSSDIIVRNNYIKNYHSAIGFSARKYFDTLKRKIHNISIYYNIIHNYGNTFEATGSAINFRAKNINDTIRDVFLYNNVIYDDETGLDPRYAFWFQPDSGHIDNIHVTNNIVMNTGINWMRSQVYQVNSTATIDSIVIRNNILYSNGGDTLFSIDANPIYENNLTSNPLFISSGSNFALQASSPARNAGYDVDLTLDYIGNVVPQEGITDIGALEYTSLPLPITGLGWDSKLYKINFKDDINIGNTWMINAVPVTATANELNATVGATGNFQGQLNVLDNDKFEKINAPLSTGTITDATGITAAMLSRYMYYSEAAATDISANPQIANGTSGQIITIIGSSDTNTLTLDDTDGLLLSAQCILGIGDTITLYYDGTIGDWIEIGRSAN